LALKFVAHETHPSDPARQESRDFLTMAIQGSSGQIAAPSEQQLHRLDAKFGASLSALHEQLESLLSCEPFTFQTKPRQLPASVVYLFAEDPIPLYVGRSNRFRQRLGNHCQQSSRSNQSVFAFKLAREAAGFTEAAYTGPNTRDGLMQNRAFVDGFIAAKQRLNRMQIRFVAETDQVRQALLEIYCAVALSTRYNDFTTH
jgi:hypothetical protein